MINKLSPAAAVLAFAGTLLPTYASAQDLYLGEIIQTGYNFCPRGTAAAAGQLLPISQYSALYSLYGTTYGGDARMTFGLPDLQGRAPIGQGRGPGLFNYQVGQRGGLERAYLNQDNLPDHNHNPRIVISRTIADSENPINSSFARAAEDTYIEVAPGTDQMHSGTIVSTKVGQNAPFSIMQPFTVMRYCVVVEGTYPPRS